jgi:hypothetical protein
MSLRRAGTLALALSITACQSVTQEPKPEKLVLATFASPNIPLPNDLALNSAATLTAPQYAAQKAFLELFSVAGGFPSDQEVSISFPVSALKLDAATGAYVADAVPLIDPVTDIASVVAVFRVDVTPPVRLADSELEVDLTTAGVVKIRKAASASGSRRWTPGARYVAAIRGGANGLQAGGLPVNADTAITLVIPNLDLTLPSNQPPGGLTPALQAQLEGLRKNLWLPLGWCNITGLGWVPPPSAAAAAACTKPLVRPSKSPFETVSVAFPVTEVASILTFTVAPEAGTYVMVDSSAGVAPLPFDLMRDPRPGMADPAKDTGLIFLNTGAFKAFATGLATLDGFSTTSMIIAQTGGNAVAGGNVIATGGAFLAGTATTSTVQLYKRSADRTAWTQVMAVGTQPSAIQAPCSAVAGAPKCSVAIGIQPAGAVLMPQTAGVAPVPGNGVSLPPLDEDSLYAVVVTNGVHDAANQPLVRSTMAKILLDIPTTATIGKYVPPVAPATVGTSISLLGGVDGLTAVGLQKMRGELDDLFTKVTSITKANVAMAYTFKTQSIKHASTLMAALPYGLDKAIFAAAGHPAITPVALTNMLLSPLPIPVPTAGVNAMYDVTFMSIDAIDKSNGALNAAALANPALLPGLLTPLHALVVVPHPTNTNIAACPAGYPAGLKCPVLVVFGQGLNQSKEDLLSNAATLASAGFIAAAVDFPLHGGRNWCRADADCLNADGSAGAAGSCNKGGAFAASAGQGDCGENLPGSAACEAARPGVCAGGTTPRVFVAGTTTGERVGSRYWLTSNFFRTRDSFRQNVLDISALTLALNRLPASLYPPQPAAGTNPFANALGGLGLAVHPGTTYYEGISLGSISGLSAVAANPRISRALFSVGGGSLMTLLTNSPNIRAASEPVVAGIIPGFTWAAVTPGSPTYSSAMAAALLKVVSVAGWITDPGDPINFAQTYKTGGGMPDFLVDSTYQTPQAAKQALGQVAYLDLTVPNISNWELYEVMGIPTSFYRSQFATVPPFAVPHSMLGTIGSVQADAAGFLMTGTPSAAVIDLVLP